MKRYQLFSEFCDAILWGKDLVDALLREKKIQRSARWDKVTQAQIPGEIITIKSIMGTRDTSNSTRGQWRYESVVCETTDGQMIEVDARVIGQLI